MQRFDSAFAVQLLRDKTREKMSTPALHLDDPVKRQKVRLNFTSICQYENLDSINSVNRVVISIKMQIFFILRANGLSIGP